MKIHSIIFTIFTVILTSCEPSPSDEKVEIKKIGQYYQGTFISEYTLGDQVSFDSKENGKGEGIIYDIIIGTEGISYSIKIDEENNQLTIQSGIYNSDMKLIKRKEP